MALRTSNPRLLLLLLLVTAVRATVPFPVNAQAAAATATTTAAASRSAPKAPKQSVSTTTTPTHSPTTRSPTGSPSVRTSLAPTSSNNNGILYGGGAVFTSPTVYVIWYGDWATPESQVTVAATELCLRSLSNTTYYAILGTYYQTTSTRDYVSSTLVFGGSTTDRYSQGASLTEGSIHAAISDAVTTHKLPYNNEGIYVLVSSGHVTEGSLCHGACGWHSSPTIGNLGRAASVFVGLAAQCATGCAPPRFFANSTHGQLADGLINVLSHELAESITDPFGDAWNSRELGDKCVWHMGAILTDPSNNKTYNIILSGGNQFTVQQLWVNADGGYCALGYP